MSSENEVLKVTSDDLNRSHRIVVGIDGSTASLAALDWAVRQAELTGSSLEIVAVWEWPNSFGWAIIPDNFNPAVDTQIGFEPILTSLRAAHPELEVQLKVIEGHPAQVLVEESRGASLLVVGSRGHGTFVGMLIGSTSAHCTATAACPVVVIR